MNSPLRQHDARAIYLTFDDGPDPRWTPRLLDLLSHYHVLATFFVVGIEVQRQQSLLRQIASRGHEIGNHTHSHRHPWTMSGSTARREVLEGSKAIEDALGKPVCLFRPPFGRRRRSQTEAASELGQQLVLWDRSAIDWGPKGVGAGIARRLGAANSGEILLLHDGQRSFNRPGEMLQVLPTFLCALAARSIQPRLLSASLRKVSVGW